jgi:hypothetical protein
VLSQPLTQCPELLAIRKFQTSLQTTPDSPELFHPCLFGLEGRPPGITLLPRISPLIKRQCASEALPESPIVFHALFRFHQIPAISEIRCVRLLAFWLFQGQGVLRVLCKRVVLGYAEQKVPALKVCANTAGGHTFGVDFLDLSESRIGRCIYSLTTKFPVDRIMNTPEPTAQCLLGLERGGQRIGLVVFRERVATELAGENIRKHLKHLFYTLLAFVRVISKCNKME